MPSHISFDHDLGADENDVVYPTGHDLAKWLVEMDMDRKLSIAYTHFDCHSANTHGRANIMGLLNGYREFS